MISNLLIGISGSLVASLVFTYYFTKVKPKIFISNEISYCNNTFKIKIINRGHYSATNIRAELCYVNYFSVPNGVEQNSKKILLTKMELFALDGLNNSDYASYTYRFVTTENLLEGLKHFDRSHIRFKLIATHSMSNISKVYVRNYALNDIKTGDFEFGNSIRIV